MIIIYRQGGEGDPINPLLRQFIPLVDFLAEVLGKDAEIVLHDISNMDSSVIAIRNGHISGRQVGAPATNLALKIIKEGQYGNTNFLTNYHGISKDNKTLKSSSYFIKDGKQRLIGMLCININYEKFTQLRDFLDAIIEQDGNDKKAIETFGNSVKEVASDSIESVIKNIGISPERMSPNEKMEVIKELNDSGVFLLKGSIVEVATQLKVSEPTIYRYLKKIKQEQSKNNYAT